MLSPRVRQALDRLNPAGRRLRCAELVRLLEDLGFEVRRGRRGNHRVVSHPRLPNFTSMSFDCGHGRDPQVRSSYVRKLRQMVREHAEALGEIL